MIASDKRRIVLILHWVLLIALSYLVIYTRGARVPAIASSVVLFLGSNLVLMRLPDRVFHEKLFRSEEHTSELQSLRQLVCRLLLEKKKPSNATDLFSLRCDLPGSA